MPDVQAWVRIRAPTLCPLRRILLLWRSQVPDHIICSCTHIPYLYPPGRAVLVVFRKLDWFATLPSLLRPLWGLLRTRLHQRRRSFAAIVLHPCHACMHTDTPIFAHRLRCASLALMLGQFDGIPHILLLHHMPLPTSPLPLPPLPIPGASPTISIGPACDRWELTETPASGDIIMYLSGSEDP